MKQCKRVKNRERELQATCAIGSRVEEPTKRNEKEQTKLKEKGQGEKNLHPDITTGQLREERKQQAITQKLLLRKDEINSKARKQRKEKGRREGKRSRAQKKSTTLGRAK